MWGQRATRHRSCAILQSSDIRFAIFTIRLKRHFPQCHPDAARMITVFAVELVGHPDECTEDDGAIVADTQGSVLLARGW
jgi:hypothetical protein